MQTAILSGVTLVTKPHSHSKKYLDFLRSCLQFAQNKGIPFAIQTREKDPDRAFALAQKVEALCKMYGAGHIVNDHPDIAKDVGATGVHLGQEDGSLIEARALLGPDKIIGLSVHNQEEMDRANALPKGTLDYVGFGPVYPTSSKDEAPLGISALEEVTQISHYPVIAIGGIQPEKSQDLRNVGVSGVAVIQAIHDDPESILSLWAHAS